jgi:ribosome biogenesis GTPase A
LNCSESKKKAEEKGMLTIGTLGHPNVGKSSLINSLCGKKVVSVSRSFFGGFFGASGRKFI